LSYEPSRNSLVSAGGSPGMPDAPPAALRGTNSSASARLFAYYYRIRRCAPRSPTVPHCSIAPARQFKRTR